MFDDPQPCTRKHHLTCGCWITPADIRTRLRRINGMTPALVDDVLCALNVSSRPQLPSGARHNRSRSHLTFPDAQGHVHWTGPWPKSGAQPRVMVNGERMTLIHFAFREAGINDIDRTWPLSRDKARCRDPLCYAPLHWAVDRDRGPEPVVADSSALLAMWDHEHPRPLSPHLNTWLFAGVNLGDVCKAGHRVNVHRGDLKSAYCPTCYQHLQGWKKRRNAYRVDLGRYGPTPADTAALREYLREQASDGEPSAAEIAEARAYLHAPSPEPTPSPEDSEPEPSACRPCKRPSTPCSATSLRKLPIPVG